MERAVFISCAHPAERGPAAALRAALDGYATLFPSDELERGGAYPRERADALLAAHVVVVFTEPAYFDHWYSLREFRAVREPFLRTAERPGSTAREKEEAILGIVAALPDNGESSLLERFPALARVRNWPAAGETEQLAGLVRAELRAGARPLHDRYPSPAAAAEARAMLLEGGRLPPPLKLGALPSVPDALPPSLHDSFVGRVDDLWRVHEALAGDRTVCLLQAGSGLGKSRLALEYVYRFGARHFGGVFWINARSTAAPQLRAVLRKLERMAPPAAGSGSKGRPGPLRVRIARALDGLPAEAPPPLFVLDGLPGRGRERGQEPPAPWAPIPGRAPVLATARTRVPVAPTSPCIALSLLPLASEPAVRLLAGDQLPALAPAAWRQIAAWAGHVPRVLMLLNVLLRSGAVPPSDLLQASRVHNPEELLAQTRNALRESLAADALGELAAAMKGEEEV